MDQNVLQQLKVVNQLRRLNKAGEEMTWVNLLEYMGKGVLPVLRYISGPNYISSNSALILETNTPF